MSLRSLKDLCPLFATLGGPNFGPAFMTLLHDTCGADLCSVFVVESGGPAILVAESMDPSQAIFARVASLRYVQRYWRRDKTALSAIGRAHSKVQVLKRPARGILDMEYRHECYTEGAVVERVSLYRSGAPAFIANAYRERESGPFAPSHLRSFAEIADVLYAAVSRHQQLVSARPVTSDPERLAQDLVGLTGLSLREAQVAALTASGCEQNEIAETLGVAPSSVVTYRKRAYQKLGVPNRNVLRERIAELLAGGRQGDPA